MRIPFYALAFTVATLSAAHSEDFPASHARTVDLGTVKGVAYYVQDQDGYRVVTTLSQGDGYSAVRFVATLKPEQKVTITVPGPINGREATVEIVRHGDKVMIARPAAATN